MPTTPTALRSRLRLLFLPALLLLLGLSTLAACGGGDVPTSTAIASTATSTPYVPSPTDTPLPEPTLTPTVEATATAVPIPLADRGFVPVLCYHHIREWVKSDTEDDRGYIVPPAKFEKELKYLKDNGYTTVSSEQIYDYYQNGKPLPAKPIMLSFDDNDDNQYTVALPLLKKYGLGATFFIMTVSIDKENYMTADQLKELDKLGYDVEPHTWDHHMVTGYKTEEDWQRQVVEPKKTLEDLLGHPTPFFAYPFGIYDSASAEKLKQYGYKAAFRLSENMDDKTDPVFAIKRYIANGYWTMNQFQLALEGNW